MATEVREKVEEWTTDYNELRPTTKGYKLKRNKKREASSETSLRAAPVIQLSNTFYKDLGQLYELGDYISLNKCNL